MKNVSIIIVTYFTGPALWLAIESSLEQTECKEVILINNGNSPGDLEQILLRAKSDARLRLITGHGNVGFAKGCNLGVTQATGDYVLLLNPDSMLPENGLNAALKSIAPYEDETLAGCYLINPDGSEQRGSRRAILKPKNALVESLGLHRFIKTERLNYHETPMPEASHEVPVISGAFMFLSRAFYTKLNGLDEGYFLHMEDTDFCYRVHKAGGKVICMPEVKVVHFRSTSEVSSGLVEKHKANGFIRYLHTHFKHEYSALFLTFMSIGIWARYVIKRINIMLDSLFVSRLIAKYEVARLVLINRLTRFTKNDDTLAGKTILVTGASGQVGLVVIGKALARGAKVIAIYNKTEIFFRHPNLTWVQSDLTDDEVSFENIKADVLIHTAALWFLPKILPKIYKTGTRRVIAFSSTSVVGKVDSKNQYEQDVVAKLEAAENAVMDESIDRLRVATILRPTMIYGVGLDANITRMADVIRRFGFVALYKPAKGLRHPVQALELAEAALNIIDNPATMNKKYNLGGYPLISYYEMVMQLFAYMGKKPNIIHLPFLPVILDAISKIYQMGNVNGEIALRMNRDLAFDMNEAMQDFNYHPKAFLEGNIVL